MLVGVGMLGWRVEVKCVVKLVMESRMKVMCGIGMV
jgi:hypothetical protein